MKARKSNYTSRMQKTATVLFGCTSIILLTTGANLPTNITPKATPKMKTGTIPGTFAVDNNGAATYKMPIEIPPGRNGVQPNLAIEYNSNAGNTLLGHGFKLTGLSAISRVGATVELDGFVGSVNFDANDRFALDGERLIAVLNAKGDTLKTQAQQNTAYGQDGTVYFTQNQIWSRVVSHTSNAKNGPDGFTITIKNGWTVTYGKTGGYGTNAWLQANEYSYNERTNAGDAGLPPYTHYTDAIAVWYMNRVKDLNGNDYSVSYMQGSYDNQMYPSFIGYTNNRYGDSERAILFHYSNSARPDGEMTYIGGTVIASRQVLTGVKIYDQYGSSTSIATIYELYYKNNRLTNRSLLDSIVVKDADGNWLPPTTFDWESEGDGGFTLINKPDSNLPGALFWHQTHEFVERAPGYPVIDQNAGMLIDSTFTVHNHVYQTTEGMLVDLNGDGISDYVYSQEGGQRAANTNVAFYGNGDGSFDLNNPVALPDYLNKVTVRGAIYKQNAYGAEKQDEELHGAYQTTEGMLVDINGDGLLDFVKSVQTENQYFDNGGYRKNKIYTNTGSGFQETSSKLPATFFTTYDPNWLPVYSQQRAIFADINADGLPDVVESVFNIKVKHEEDTIAYIEPATTSNIFFNTTKPGLAPAFNTLANTSYLPYSYHPFPFDAWYYHVPVYVTWTEEHDYQKRECAKYDLRFMYQDARPAYINGDNLVDLVALNGGIYLNVRSGENDEYRFQVANYRAPLTVSELIARIDEKCDGIYYTLSKSSFIDINGDGLADQVDGEFKKIQINTGKGFVPAYYDLPGALFEVIWDKKKERWFKKTLGILNDLNGDGLPDYISFKYSFLSTFPPRYVDPDIYFNTGEGFALYNYKGKNTAASNLNTINFLYQNFDNASVPNGALQDMNGDGFADVIIAYNDCAGKEDKTCYLSGPTSNVKVVALGQSTRNVVTKITNGLGSTRSIGYKPMTDKSVYAKYPVGAKKHDTYPEQYVQNERYVVAHDSVTDGNGNTYSKSYHYSGGKVLLTGKGRGWLGFFSKIETDDQTKTSSTTWFNQTWPTTGRIDSSLALNTAGEPMRKVQYTYGVDETSFHNVAHILLKHERTENYMLGQHIFTSGKGYVYDDFGNVRTLADTADVAKSATEAKALSEEVIYNHNAYINDTTQWRLGYLNGKKVTTDPQYANSFPGFTPGKDVELHSIEYDPNYNIRKQLRWDQENQQWIGSTFEYDQYGNLIAITDALGGKAQISYDKVFNTFISTKTSPAPESGKAPLVTQFKYDTRSGALLEETDANGVVTRYNVDGFGRTTSTWVEISDAGSKKQFVQIDSVEIFSDSGVGTKTVRKKPVWKGSKDYVNTTMGGNSAYVTPGRWQTETEYRDALGREYKTETTGPDGKTITKSKSYTSAGQVGIEHLPHFSNEKSPATINNFNDDGLVSSTFVVQDFESYKNDTMAAAFGRGITIRPPKSYQAAFDRFGIKNAVTFAYAYDASEKAMAITRASYIENNRFAKTRLFVNARGKIIKRIDDNGAKTVYQYDALGRPTSVVDPADATTTTVYNSMGLKKSVNIDGAGSVHFTYDTNGLLLKKVDGNSSITTFKYDKLGRVIEKKVGYNSSGLDFERGIVFDTTLVTYSYDDFKANHQQGRGRLTQAVMQGKNQDKNNWTTISKNNYRYEHSAAVRVDYLSVQIGNSPVFSSKNVYLPNGKIMLQTLPDSSLLSYQYHPNGSLASIDARLNTNQIASVKYGQYTALEQAQKVTYQNQVNSTYRFNNGLLAEHKVYKDASNPMIDNTYSWNSAFDLTQITDNRDIAENQKETQHFFYDTVGRLDSAYAANSYGGKKYGYDLAGNITLKDGNELKDYFDKTTGKTRTISYVGLSSVNIDIENNGTISKIHDFGDDEPKWQYYYNAENLLHTAIHNTGDVNRKTSLATYSYDHTGRLIKEQHGPSMTNYSDSTILHISPQFKKVIPKNAGKAYYISYIIGPDGKEASITRLAANVKLVTAKNGGLAPIVLQKPGFFTWLQQKFDLFFTASQTTEIARWISGWLILASLGLFLLAGFGSLFRFRNDLVYRRNRYGLWRRCLAVPVLGAFILLAVFGETVQATAAPIPTTASASTDAVVYYYHHDHISSVNLITDASGNEVYRAVYAPFGTLFKHSGTLASTFAPSFSGGIENTDVGIINFGARWYNPKLGRFLTADTELGADPYSPEAFNRFAYSGNNPVDDFDPSGHSFIIALAVAAVIGAFIGALADAVVQFLYTAEINWGAVGIAFVAGFVGGAVTFGVGTLAEGLLAATARAGIRLLSAAANNLAVSGAGNIGIGAASGSAGMSAGQTVANGINAGHGNSVDWGASMKIAAISGAVFGAIGQGITLARGKSTLKNWVKNPPAEFKDAWSEFTSYTQTKSSDIIAGFKDPFDTAKKAFTNTSKVSSSFDLIWNIKVLAFTNVISGSSSEFAYAFSSAHHPAFVGFNNGPELFNLGSGQAAAEIGWWDSVNEIVQQWVGRKK